MNDAAVVVTDENLLASAADLLSVLSRLAEPTDRRSSRKRQEMQWAHNAFSELFPRRFCEPEAANVTPVPPRNPAKSVTPAKPRPAAACGEPAGHVPQPHRHAHCRCGSCRWCLDNIRWDRIFNEKFADPTYYAGLRYRQVSTLSGLR